MSTFGELVKRLRKERSMTLEQVARKVGSHKGYVSGIENGKVNPPSVKFIRKFSKLFTYDEKTMVRMAYLDKAPKLVREEIAQAVAGGGAPAPVADDSIRIPLLNTAESGYATEVTDGRPKPRSTSILCLPKTASPAKFAATVCDSSMERPEGFSLSKGDIVFLAPVEHVRNGSFVFVIYSAKSRRAGVIRQVMLEQNDHVVLQPLNKEFPLEFLTHDDIDAVFQIVGRLELFEEAPVKTTA